MNLDYQKLIKAGKAKDKFRIIKIANITIELCAGTHLENTKEIEDVIISECVKKSRNIYEIKCIGGSSNISDILQEQEILDREKFTEIFNKIQNIEKELDLNLGNKKPCDLSFPKDLNYYKNFISDRTCFFEAKTRINDNLFKLNQIYKEKHAENCHFKLNQFKNHLLTLLKEKICVIYVEGYDHKELLKFLQEYRLPKKTECLVVLNQINDDSKKSISFLISGDPATSLNVLHHLKTGFGAFGGGKKVISGNINNHSNNSEIVEEIKKYIYNACN